MVGAVPLTAGVTATRGRGLYYWTLQEVEIQSWCRVTCLRAVGGIIGNGGVSST